MKTIITLLSIIILASCAPQRLCMQKWATVSHDTTYITKQVNVPVYVEIPADSLTWINIDSLLTYSDSVTGVSEHGRAQLTLWRDRHNRLNARADCLADTIEVIKEVTIEVPVIKEVVQWKELKPTFWQVFKNSFIGLLVLMLIIFIFRRFII